MINPIQLLTNFNKAYKLPVNRKPTLISIEESNLKFKLIQEELNEYKKACSDEDLVEVCDAIIDLTYVIYGMVVQHGLTEVFDKMFEEVHKSNMSKLENGKVLTRSDGKILKGSEYFKPNLKKYLNE
tara:strand:+ start:128 stop:508 length:381 start_codon:yes stop_codon:yes gene_type:complete